MPDAVRFTETMRGRLAPAPGATHEAAAALPEAQTSLFVLTVVTPDVDRMVADPDHRSPAYGCLLAPALHPRPLRVTAGHLDLFADADPSGRVLHMRYLLRLADEDGGDWTLTGVKEVCRRRWWPTFLVDTTTLFTDVYRGAEPRPTLRGVLWMGPVGFFSQVLSFRGEGRLLGARGIVRYLWYYAARVAGVVLGPRTAPLRPTWAAEARRAG